jgi:hypothetical protein
MRAEVTRRRDVTAPPSGEEHARWRRDGQLRRGPLCLLTPLALGLVRIPSERFGVALASGRFGRCGNRLAAAPVPMGQANQ